MKQSKTKTNNSGITLIALIITIVILLILAGIVLGTLKGKNGIIKKADEADLKTTHLGVKEKMEFLALQKESYRDETDFIEYLKSKGYIDDDGIIDMKKVFDKGTNYGNGTNEKDVYKIVKDDKYVLNYYDKSGAATEVWSMKNDTISVGDNNDPEEGEKIAEVSWIYYENSNGDLIITGLSQDNSDWEWNDFKIYEGNSVSVNGDILEFPSYINGKKVVTVNFNIGSWTSVDVLGPKKLVFGDTIEKITAVGTGPWGNKDMRIYFKGFEEVKLPQNLKIIDNGISLRSSTTIKIPSSVTTIYDNYVFDSNTTITLEKGSTLEIPADKWGAKDVIREQ